MIYVFWSLVGATVRARGAFKRLAFSHGGIAFRLRKLRPTRVSSARSRRPIQIGMVGAVLSAVGQLRFAVTRAVLFVVAGRAQFRRVYTRASTTLANWHANVLCYVIASLADKVARVGDTYPQKR